MKDGTIALVRYKGNGKWYERFVKWCITKITKSPYYHILVYSKGRWYESVFPMGAIRHMKDQSDNDILEPIEDLNETQKARLHYWVEAQVTRKTKYNILKLVSLAIMYPLKKFFNWLGIIAFRNNRLWGTVCSVFVDEAFKYAGVDVFKNMTEELTAPGDFTNTGFFQPVE